MKKGLIIAIVWGIWALCSCQEVTVGFLQVENAVYVPDSMDIRLVLDENLDAYRMHNLSPWVSPKMQGVIGTNPLLYGIEEVRASEGGNAELFKHLLRIRGGGRMEYPLISDTPPAEYTVSVRVYNEGYSQVVKDAFTFVVK